jgi:amidohydrolase
MNNLKETIQHHAAAQHEALVAIRRHLHAHPELSFQEYHTAKFIAKALRETGLEVQEGIANTGLVVHLKGKNPTQKTVALRADIDALPIQEENDVSYRSTSPGVMHACGHDVHTASLIGVARILQQLQDHFEGTIKLIFQPAEEKIPGGALQMIQEGVLGNPRPCLILGQHVSPEVPVGKVAVTKGIAMASADELYLTIQGRGSHAAAPHLAVDPILIAAHLVLALQQLVSRNSPPLQPGVLSICSLQAGHATNVIPAVAHLAGTLRTVDEAWRRLAHQKIITLSQQLAESMGGTCHVDIKKGYPPLYNNPDLTEQVMTAAKVYLGTDNIYEKEMSMGAEDFAYYAQELPACFYFIGIQNTSMGIDAALHTSTFNVDETVLKIAPGLMAWLALQALHNA